MYTNHREYFNNLAPVWHEKMPPLPEMKDYLILFGIQSGEHVLDIGCGTGRMTRYIGELAGNSGTVIGQDIADQMLVEARKRLPKSNIFLLCNNVLHLSFKDEIFDKILCFSAFPHFTDKRKSLSEITRILKPNGKLLILHTQSSQKMNIFHQNLGTFVKDDRLPDLQEMHVLIQNLGLQVIQMKEKDDLYWVELMKCRIAP